MPMKPVRVGVLCPAFAMSKNACGIAHADGVEIVCIGAESLDKADKCVKELIQKQHLNAPCKPVGSYEEVLEFPDLDAVYIPLPSAAHMPWVAKAAAKGLHILLEKPIAATPDDLHAMCQAIEKHNVLMMDGGHWLHSPRTRQMESLIRDAHKFGPIVHVNSTFTYATDEEFQRSNIRAKPESEPLGCLGDLGWYCACAALWAYNCEPPEMVIAHPGTTRNDKNVPMYTAATLLWPMMPNNPRRRAVFACGYDQALTQTLEIYTPKSSVYLRDFIEPFNGKKSFFTHTHDHKWGEMETADLTQRDEVWVEMPQPQETYMWEEFANMVRNVRDKGAKPDKRWSELAIMTQKVLLAVELSSQKGHVPVKVADMQPCPMPSM